MTERYRVRQIHDGIHSPIPNTVQRRIHELME